MSDGLGAARSGVVPTSDHFCAQAAMRPRGRMLDLNAVLGWNQRSVERLVSLPLEHRIQLDVRVLIGDAAGIRCAREFDTCGIAIWQ